jgi:xanthine dehydrogenase accessory factor
MRRGMAEALLAARRAARAVVLVTPLDGSAQRLLDEPALQLLQHTDPELAAAAREALRSDRAAVLPRDGGEWLLAPHNPPLRLVVVGAVHISESLCAMARQCGYAVSVVDPRSAFLRPERFPGVELIGQWPQQAFATLKPDARTAVVLLTHDPKIDDPALLAVLPTAAFYVGALGSTRTHAKRLERLAAAGISEADRARIHGPAGLSIGARTPAEIAVSVLAQVTSALRGGKA